MLIMKLKHYLLASLAIAGALCMSSCNDDDTYDVVGNPNNIVYMKLTQDANTFNYNLLHTPIGPKMTSAPDSIEVYVSCTKKSDKDIKVTFELDPTIVGEDAEALTPGMNGLSISMPNPTVTIPAGANTSTKTLVVVDYENADLAAFADGKYVLPIKVASATDAVPSEDLTLSLGYINLNVATTTQMVNPDSDGQVGERITDYAKWTGTWEAPNAGVSTTSLNMSKCNSNSQWNYCFFRSNHADKCNEEVILNFDFGEVITVRGFLFRYYYAWYTVKDLKLETSVDGVNYTDQGTRTWDANTIERYMNLWAPMEVRYVRATTHSFYGGTGEGTAFSNFNAYK